MDRTPSLRLRLGRPALLALAFAAGCAANTGTGGTGGGPDLAAPCVGPKCVDPNGCDKEADCTDPARPRCEMTSHKCVPCLSNADCALGRICFPATHTCTAGCAPGHGCPADGGVCEADAGSCVECNGDNDCLDAAKPRCDLVSRRCFECNPQNDNCGFARVCVPNEGQVGFACRDGCKDDVDCQPPGGGGDGGVADGGMPSQNTHCEPKKKVCVRCLVDDDCPLGRICKANQCVAGCTEQHGCDNGLTCCDIQGQKACTDTRTDFQNCGGCGVVCQGGWNCCDSLCSNPVNDVKNCGMCGTVCMTPHATPGCAARACVIAQCDQGWADCLPAPGCETNIDNNVNNCGACNNTCSLANALPKCVGGACGVNACLPGYGDCDGKAPNGCEIDLNKDPGNCGSCGTACSGNHISQPTCGSGTCNGVCDVNFADCNMNKAKDGCEVDLKNDAANCGVCGTVCANTCAGNVVGTTCSAGACAVTMCGANFFDVDKLCNNGCECRQSPGGAAACANAQTTNVGLKAQPIRLTGTMVTQAEAWYAFTFAGLVDPSLAFHPAVSLLPNDNPNNAFSFTIYSDCKNTTPICGSKDNPPKANGEVPGALGWTSWEVSYGGLGADGNAHPMPNIVGNDVGNTPSPNAGDYASHLNPIPVNVIPATVFVKVVRNGGIPAKSCADYTFTLTVSNG